MDIWWRWLLSLYILVVAAVLGVSIREARRFTDEPAQKWWFVLPGALAASGAVLFLLGSRLAGFTAAAAALLAAGTLPNSDLARQRHSWRDLHHPGWRRRGADGTGYWAGRTAMKSRLPGVK